jgi:hypothetical protein
MTVNVNCRLHNFFCSFCNRAINFHPITAFAEEIKDLIARNDYEGCIIAETLVHMEVVWQKPLKGEVLPLSLIPRLNIDFQSSSEMNFDQSLKFLANRIHLFAFTVSAHIGLIELQLSRQPIDFRRPIDFT